MTFTPVSKLLVDHNGYLWVLPRLSENGLWQIGIGVFRGDAWSVYSPVSLPMGTFGGNTDHGTLIEQAFKDGETEWRIWAGTSSGHVKQYKPEINVWSSIVTLFNTPVMENSIMLLTVLQALIGQNAMQLHRIHLDISDEYWEKSQFSTSYGAILCYDGQYELILLRII